MLLMSISSGEDLICYEYHVEDISALDYQLIIDNKVDFNSIISKHIDKHKDLPGFAISSITIENSVDMWFVQISYMKSEDSFADEIYDLKGNLVEPRNIKFESEEEYEKYIYG